MLEIIRGKLIVSLLRPYNERYGELMILKPWQNNIAELYSLNGEYIGEYYLFEGTDFRYPTVSEIAKYRTKNQA